MLGVAAPGVAQRTLISVRSILDLGDRVVEDVEWSAGDVEPLQAIASSRAETSARRATAIVVLREHFSHAVGGLFVDLACEESDAGVVSAAMAAEGFSVAPTDPNLDAARSDFCASRRPVAGPLHPSDIRPAIGGTFEPAAGYDDEGGVLILGLGLSTRFGVRFPNQLAILLQIGAVAQTALSDEVRTYLGVGPALIFDIGFVLAPDSAFHLGIGNGFDFGESVVSSGGVATAVSGIFPTFDLYGLTVVERGFSVGVHLHVAVPLEAPDHFGITGALMFGGETL